MKTISKLMIGIVLAAFTIFNVSAQPKSEIPDDTKPKMNWSGADTLYTFQFITESNSWIYFQREIRRFDATKNPIENYVQLWDNASKKWNNYLRVNYTYDENGKQIEEITQQWDSSFKDWVNAQLRTTTYKGRNKEEVLFQEWKRPTNEWYNMMKYLIKYNDNGKERSISVNLYNGITKQWDNYKKFTMEFESEFAHPSIVFSENWDQSLSIWKLDGKYELKYNFRSDKTQETKFTWNQSLNDYVEGIQINYIYDKKGNQTQYLEKKFDFSNKTWVDFNKSYSKYDEAGNMIEKIESIWNRNSNQWEIKGQYKFTTETKI